MAKNCEICGRKVGMFERSVKNGASIYHKKCYDADKKYLKLEQEQSSGQDVDLFQQIKEEQQEKEFQKYRENFAKVKFDFQSDLESLIEIDYSKPVESRVRLFFGQFELFCHY